MMTVQQFSAKEKLIKYKVGALFMKMGTGKTRVAVELVKRMVELGMEDFEIGKQLGIDADEFLRLKRNVKIAEIYKDLNFSNSWEFQSK